MTDDVRFSTWSVKLDVRKVKVLSETPLLIPSQRVSLFNERKLMWYHSLSRVLGWSPDGLWVYVQESWRDMSETESVFSTTRHVQPLQAGRVWRTKGLRLIYFFDDFIRSQVSLRLRRSTLDGLTRLLLVQGCLERFREWMGHLRGGGPPSGLFGESPGVRSPHWREVTRLCRLPGVLGSCESFV